MQPQGWRLLPGRGRFRSVVTVAGVLLVAAGTQVIPSLPPPPASIPSVTAALPGVPFEARIAANLERVAEAATGAAADVATVYESILAEGRQLLHFDPDANRGRGAWAELVGAIDERTEAVGVLVPGSAAFIHDANFRKYHQRASHLVEESDGRLAVVVWAAGTFPKGWLQGAITAYEQALGRSLADFSHELRREIDFRLGSDTDVQLVVAGHSFGGAVVGAAERFGLDADVILHIASAGMGQVRDPYDYPDPTRPRYSITAPGDLISFVQGLQAFPWVGHGPDPGSFRCVVVLSTGRLPASPTATDEFGQQLGSRAGEPIGGVSSHSEVFIRYSDAWYQIFRVFIGQAPAPPDCPPPSGTGPLKARVLPLAVPRIATDSQCRAGGLRPGGRHRMLRRKT